MKIINKLINSPLLHPILFSIFPILSLWANNSSRMRPIETVLPLTVSVVCFLCLFLFIRLISRDWTKAGLLTSLAVVLFFSYGHVYGFLKGLSAISARLGSNRLLVPLWAAILLTVGYFIIRYGKGAFKLNLLLNLMSGILVLTTCTQLIYTNYSQMTIKLNQNLAALQDKNAFVPSRITDTKNLPDVYLIVLDAYAREDILRQQMNYDNGPFLRELKDMGFVIPDCTMANYFQTIYAMSAYLNMNYIDNFYTINPEFASVDYPYLADFIRHSLVRKNLVSLGYKTISFETQYNFVELTDADVFFTRTSRQAVVERLLDETEFRQILIDTTALKLLPTLEENTPVIKKNKIIIDDFLKRMNNIMDRFKGSVNADKYDQVMIALDNLETVPGIPGHKFVYLHLSSPHMPWVFGQDGKYKIEGRVPGYTDAVSYLDKRLPIILRKIISQSNVPPVIILQGDHGFGTGNQYSRFLNLNAYYLPGDGIKLVYPTITPVNSFRLIFNAYFGGKYEMLDDNGYMLGTGDHRNFTTVPSTCVR